MDRSPVHDERSDSMPKTASPGLSTKTATALTMTPEQRRLRAQIAANARWSKARARENQAAAAREAIYTRLAREVDPDYLLPPDQRAALMRAAGRRMSARMNAAKARKRAMLSG